MITLQAEVAMAHGMGFIWDPKSLDKNPEILKIPRFELKIPVITISWDLDLFSWDGISHPIVTSGREISAQYLDDILKYGIYYIIYTSVFEPALLVRILRSNRPGQTQENVRRKLARPTPDEFLCRHMVPGRKLTRQTNSPIPPKWRKIGF